MANTKKAPQHRSKLEIRWNEEVETTNNLCRWADQQENQRLTQECGRRREALFNLQAMAPALADPSLIGTEKFPAQRLFRALDAWLMIRDPSNDDQLEHLLSVGLIALDHWHPADAKEEALRARQGLTLFHELRQRDARLMERFEAEVSSIREQLLASSKDQVSRDPVLFSELLLTLRHSPEEQQAAAAAYRGDEARQWTGGQLLELVDATLDDSVDSAGRIAKASITPPATFDALSRQKVPDTLFSLF